MKLEAKGLKADLAGLGVCEEVGTKLEADGLNGDGFEDAAETKIAADGLKEYEEEAAGGGSDLEGGCGGWGG